MILPVRMAHPGTAILDGVAALPGGRACNAVFVAFLEKVDVTPEELELLSNRLGRLSWERARAQHKKDLP